MGEVFLEALIDTVKISWLLLIIHILIEILEYSSAPRVKLNKLLTGKVAPLIGAGVGLIPQCGFSVVATNLYVKKRVSLGALLAVFIATSDETIPILLSSGSILKLLPLIIIKFVFAVIVGYAVMFIFDRKKNYTLQVNTQEQDIELEHKHEHKHKRGHAVEREQSQEVHERGREDNKKEQANADCASQNKEDADNDSEKVSGCHGHKIGGKEKSKLELLERFLFHPILHTLTVLAYIFIVNVIFGVIIYYVTEERLTAFMQSAKYAQPFLAALIGIIPNCGASVAIAQMYAIGGLNLGAAVAGLSVNAGLGFAVLFKQNKNIKQNLSILFGLYGISVIAGTLITLFTNLIF